MTLLSGLVTTPEVLKNTTSLQNSSLIQVRCGVNRPTTTTTTKIQLQSLRLNVVSTQSKKSALCKEGTLTTVTISYFLKKATKY